MKNPLIAVVLVIVVGVGAFYGGMQYQKGHSQTSGGNQTGQFFAGGGGNGARNGNGRTGRGFGNGAGAVRGEIISSDGKTMTVKLPDGSSKIVIISSSTAIDQATSATPQDLTSGKQVMVFGSTNSDGSVTAQNIQLNPQERFGGAGRQGTPKPTQ